MDLTEKPYSGLEPALELRRMLTKARGEIRGFHARGGSGEQVTAALTMLCDRVIARAYDLIDDQTGRRDRIANELALIAVGGYGRADLAPYSDVDLLFLTAQPADDLLRQFVAAMVRLLWDAGLSVAQSVRTPAESVAFARQDLMAWTALTEARLLRGNVPLFKDLRARTHKLIRRRSVRQLAEHILKERSKEQTDDPDATVCLLEPNIKKSAGGLREYHLIRWVGRTRYAAADPPALRDRGHLSDADCDHVLATREFLLRIRNELHFNAGSAQDVLTLDEQVRIALWLGWTDSDEALAVERFMQHYYRHTTALHEIALRFARAAWAGRRPTWVHALSRRRLEAGFVIEAGHLRTDDRRPPSGASRESAEHWLRLLELARCYDVPVSPKVLERVRVSAPAAEVTPETRRFFMQILANPLGLARLLRELHQVGLLGRLIPPFEHLRCLIQFNQYHKFTVDEHTLRVIDAATHRIEGHDPIAAAYRRLRHKNILHLAILLHDAGKGYAIDHSEKGAELAEAVALDFDLPDRDRDVLVFLVRHHLLMAHTAQRRDIFDPQTIVQFARQVRTPEVLTKLFLLTLADTQAVSPGNLTKWKETLLIQLYTRAMQLLTGQVPDDEARAGQLREELERTAPTRFDREWLRDRLTAVPDAYLMAMTPTRIIQDLEALERYRPGGVVLDGRFDPQTQVSTYTVVTGEGQRPGVFSRIAGVLAASGFQILAAQIVTLADGLVLDTFETLDLDFAGPPPHDRAAQLERKLQDVVSGRRTVESLFGQRFVPRQRKHTIQHQPTQVETDNTSSDRFTILEVFADDRQGLLYVITRTLFELGISIHAAKIATHRDQIVDVFYVTDADGSRIIDEARLTAITRELLQSIEKYAGMGTNKLSNEE